MFCGTRNIYGEYLENTVIELPNSVQLVVVVVIYKWWPLASLRQGSKKHLITETITKREKDTTRHHEDEHKTEQACRYLLLDHITPMTHRQLPRTLKQSLNKSLQTKNIFL